MSFIWETPEEINLALAHRLRGIRKRKNLTQQQLSEKSNVSFGSIKRFETTGQISLISLTKLAVALDCTEHMKRLFADVYGLCSGLRDYCSGNEADALPAMRRLFCSPAL